MTLRPTLEDQARQVVAVTGASGYIGARLLQQLEDEVGLDKLVAIDTRPMPLPIHNIAVYRRDVTDLIDDALLQNQVSTLVHLAFVSRRGNNRRESDSIRQTNLTALRSVLESCVRARVGHFIYLSSHTVYGAHRDNPVPLTEEATLRPSTGFPYGYDKFLAEQVIQDFAQQHPDIRVTILRSCVVLGPTASITGPGNHVARAFFRPWLLGVQGHDPPLQFLYEDDLARILAIAIRRRLAGVFNVAGDGVVFYREVAEIMNSRLIRLPAFLAYPLVQLTWELRLQRDSTASGLDLVRYPIVLSTGKLKQSTDYRFCYTSLDAVTAFANSGFQV